MSVFLNIIQEFPLTIRRENFSEKWFYCSKSSNFDKKFKNEKDIIT